MRLAETKKASPEMKALKSILLAHKGRDHGITSGEIAILLEIDEDDTHQVVRKMIKECAYLYHMPLAADRNGYYVITSKEELDDYCHNLTMRAKTINKRKRRMEDFYAEFVEAKKNRGKKANK